jgi:hypothetical protein
MTPNWQFLAAFEEAMHEQLGHDYELYGSMIRREKELGEIKPEPIRKALMGARHVGVVHLLCPQQIVGAFRTKSYLVHDRALFDLMERLERAGLPSVYPHSSHLYRVFTSKEWPAQLCLAPAFRVPLCTRVPRGSVAQCPNNAAEEALGALAMLRIATSSGAAALSNTAAPAAPQQLRCVAKLACSWKSEGVVMCDGTEELALALSQFASTGEHSSYLVQERIDGVICEASVYLLRGKMAGFRYYRFPHHRAPPEYMARGCAAGYLGGEQAVIQAEEVMGPLALQWYAWAKAQCSASVPFMRVDFLLAKQTDGSTTPSVWTGELSELSVAVSFEGLSDEASRKLVFEAVLSDVVQGK